MGALVSTVSECTEICELMGVLVPRPMAQRA
jgi:hypothetical protein